MTKVADVIVPEIFNPYVLNRSAELSNLIQSGIIQGGGDLDALAASGGRTIQMPFWNDLTGDDEVLSDSSPLTPGKIDTGKDVAVLLTRGKAWSTNDLAKALSGDDPMKAIGDLVASYWARRRQATTISILAGVFGSASMSDNVLDISAEVGDLGVFSGSTFIDAAHKLGDAESRLTAVAVHSVTFASMRKQNLIEFVPNSQGVYNIPTYLGKNVIIDDGLPYTDGTATTYIFGQGALGLGNGAAPVPTETDRDSLQGDDILINRQHFILHPRGIKFNDVAVAGKTPTNSELANALNWTKVYDAKNVRMIAFKHKIA